MHVDTPYAINSNNTDRYPLIAPFKSFKVSWNNNTYTVNTISNSRITNLSFNPDAMPYPTLSFNVTGVNGTMGFCRIAIPKTLMWCRNDSEWRVIVNSTPYSNQTITSSGNYTYIYFAYQRSTEIVQLKSKYAVPELQPLMLPLLLTVLTRSEPLPAGRNETQRHTLPAISKSKSENAHLSICSACAHFIVRQPFPSIETWG